MQWYAATRRVVGFTVAFAVVVVAGAVFTATRAGQPISVHESGAVAAALVVGLSAIVVLLGLLITVPFWIWAAIRQTRVSGAPAYGHLGFWGAGAFVVLFAAGFFVPGGVYAAAALRLVGAALLIGGVLHTGAWVRRQVAPDRPYAADRYSLVTGGDPAAPLTAQPTADDWNAGQWDPDVDREIERRRHDGR